MRTLIVLCALVAAVSCAGHTWRRKVDRHCFDIVHDVDPPTGGGPFGDRVRTSICCNDGEHWHPNTVFPGLDLNSKNDQQQAILNGYGQFIKSRHYPYNPRNCPMNSRFEKWDTRDPWRNV